MGEKKSVGNFLRKTFALKKNEEEQAETKTAAKPATKAAAKPATKAAAKPATKAAAKPAARATVKPAARAAAKPATKVAAKPATKAAAKPATKATEKPAARAAAKPATKATEKPVTKAAAKPVTKAAAKPAIKAAAKPATKAAAKPATKEAAKPAAKTASASVTKPTAIPPKTVSGTVKKTEMISTATTAAVKTKTPVEFSKNMTKADNVRLYIYQNYLKPAKLKGQNKITLIAGDIHTEMGLKSEMPTVTAAMKTRIDRLYDVEILDVKPPGGANSKLTVRYDLKNLYMEEESIKTVPKKIEKAGAEKTINSEQKEASDPESSYLILKELEEKLRIFVSDRVEARFGKEWWKGTDMSFLAERWNERRIMNDRTNPDKKRKTNEPLINYAGFSDYRRIINNPFAWDAFEEYFPDRGWIIQRLKELDPIRNAIMHHTPLEEDDYLRLELYARDILKIIDKTAGKSKT